MELDRLFTEGVSPKSVVLYVYCCHKANWKDGKWIIGNHEIKVSKGEFITSQDHLADAIGFTRDEIRTAIKQLSICGFITQETTKRYTKIHVVKYCGNENAVFENTKTSPSLPQVFPTVVDVKTLRRKETAFASLENLAEPATARPAVKEAVPLPPPLPAFDRPFPLGEAEADLDPLDALTKKGKIRIYNGPK